MNKNKRPLRQVTTKETLNQNTIAIKGFDFYKKTRDIIDKAEFALGRKSKTSFSSNTTNNSIINTKNAPDGTAKI